MRTRQRLLLKSHGRFAVADLQKAEAASLASSLARDLANVCYEGLQPAQLDQALIFVAIDMAKMPISDRMSRTAS
jgi:hypothetical protein